VELWRCGRIDFVAWGQWFGGFAEGINTKAPRGETHRKQRLHCKAVCSNNQLRSSSTMTASPAFRLKADYRKAIRRPYNPTWFCTSRASCSTRLGRKKPGLLRKWSPFCWCMLAIVAHLGDFLLDICRYRYMLVMKGRWKGWQKRYWTHRVLDGLLDRLDRDGAGLIGINHDKTAHAVPIRAVHYGAEHVSV
jgi:hypothetical protein